jgi:hypothetical protein
MAGEDFKFESAMIAKKRLPKDIIKFRKGTAYPFVYSEVFLKIGKYARLANLADYLVRIRVINKENKKLLRMDRRLSFIKVLFEGATLHEYKPSIKSIFTPIIKQV